MDSQLSGLHIYDEQKSSISAHSTTFSPYNSFGIINGTTNSEPPQSIDYFSLLLQSLNFQEECKVVLANGKYYLVRKGNIDILSNDILFQQKVQKIASLAQYIPIKVVKQVQMFNGYAVIFECPFIVSSLANMINHHSTPPPITITRYLFKTLIHIVSLLHQNQIAHRNLSLDNIYLTFDAQTSTYSLMLSCFEYATTDVNKPLAEDKYQTKYFFEKNGVYQYPKKRDMCSLGIILFILTFSYNIQTENGSIKSLDWLNVIQKFKPSSWDSRPKWKILKNMLRMRHQSSEEAEQLKNLINNLVTKIDSIEYYCQNIIQQSEWLQLALASSYDIREYI
jgi:serine/threonine protein kinase